MSAFTEANRKAFNDLSASYNSKPWQHKLSQQVSDALQQRRDWLGVRWTKADDGGRDVRLLDYACGTGAITKALGPYVTTIRGIDISDSMVEKYNEASQSSGLKPEQGSAVVGDLLSEQVSPQLSGPEYQLFDIAVIGLGFHHFEDPALAIKRLTERLKPETGVLVIIDFLPFSDKLAREREQRQQDPSADFPDMSHTIKHSGFTREQMQKLYEDGGLEDFGWHVLPDLAVMELKGGTKERTIFIAKGRRSPTGWGKLRNWFGSMQAQMAGQLSLEPDGRYGS
ncbi:hypothetical protein B0A55_11675 [Friedmanniomyces simplex]|uniref:Methyltransferase domain-containing protein n=1 Tax=Friedmanniomyces simplex TaxID=329884 RepID=A0A4U0W2K0_9PEZI|nr:hypothetical protein B0A55_11675 [Friedmanniomyces simplex]